MQDACVQPGPQFDAGLREEVVLDDRECKTASGFLVDNAFKQARFTCGYGLEMRPEVFLEVNVGNRSVALGIKAVEDVFNGRVRVVGQAATVSFSHCIRM